MDVLFEKNSVINGNYEWFKNKLEPNFKIMDDNKSKVIFGFNGIGKSTIFKCIKELDNPKIEYLEYIDTRGQIVKSKKTLSISPYINEIEELNNKISPLENSLNSQKIMKDLFGFSKAGEAKAYGQRVGRAWSDKNFSGFKKTNKDIKKIENLLSNVTPKAFIKSFAEINAVQNVQQELENERDHALFHILNDIDKITEPTDSICPVCENDVPNLKQIIQKKMNTLNEKKSDLIEKLKEENIIVDEKTINNIIEAHRLLNSDDELKEDYILCGGKTLTFDSMSRDYNEYLNLNKQLQPLLTQAQKSYNNIKNVKNAMESDFKRYFGLSSSNSIEYDDNKFIIKIKFDRDIETYSTGELNLLVFLYKIYSFLGSDKIILLLDDPVSSLDLVNHYKIAYEIVKNSATKTIIVLTHSVEFINVVNSQHPNIFDFYYLEESNGIISLQNIPKKGNSTKPNIITLDKLEDINISGFEGFIKTLKARDSNIQKLFHYTVNEEYLGNDPQKFSNHKLASLIENFNGFILEDFYKNSYIKILYLGALRIWLEKKLYNLISTNETQLQNNFLNARTINKKIDCILPKDGSNVTGVSIPQGLTRDTLMSKKVMLNQSIHYDSQVLPFAYAINLSLDMLKEEISELKEIFK